MLDQIRLCAVKRDQDDLGRPYRPRTMCDVCLLRAGGEHRVRRHDCHPGGSCKRDSDPFRTCHLLSLSVRAPRHPGQTLSAVIVSSVTGRASCRALPNSAVDAWNAGRGGERRGITQTALPHRPRGKGGELDTPRIIRTRSLSSPHHVRRGEKRRANLCRGSEHQRVTVGRPGGDNFSGMDLLRSAAAQV